MKYLIPAVIGLSIGLFAAAIQLTIQGVSLEYSDAEQALIDCKPTNMYAVSVSRKVRVYDCGGEK